MKNTSLLLFLVVVIMACGQDNTVNTPDQSPQVEVDFTNQAVQFPPMVADEADRSDWKERSYGDPAILLRSPVNLPNTGDMTPESARAYIDKNDTWAASMYREVQVILNYVEYKPEVNVQLNAITDHAVREMAAEAGVSGQQSRNSPIEVEGADRSIRVDGIQYHRGELNYWLLITMQKGQRIWQLTAIYPETYRPGPGDVEFLINSIKIP